MSIEIKRNKSSKYIIIKKSLLYVDIQSDKYLRFTIQTKIIFPHFSKIVKITSINVIFINLKKN